MSTLVSVIIPTRNEESNIAILLSKLSFASNELQFEAIVVDDSSDNTPVIAARMGARVVKGQGKGLGQAIIDGIDNSKGEIIVVMDADGQHPPSSIPRLLQPILEQGADLAIGSRYVKGGCNPGWTWSRRFASRVACAAARPITNVKDASSGFFAIRRSILEN